MVKGGRAQRPPYIEIVAPRYPLDLEEKLTRAVKFTGPKLFLALSACPTGWLYDPGETPEVAKLVVKTGLCPRKRRSTEKSPTPTCPSFSRLKIISISKAAFATCSSRRCRRKPLRTFRHGSTPILAGSEKDGNRVLIERTLDFIETGSRCL